METNDQYELDFEGEDAKLRVRAEIDRLRDAMEGPISPQHLGILIEKATEGGMQRELTAKESENVKNYAELCGSIQKIDAEVVINFLFESHNKVA